MMNHRVLCTVFVSSIVFLGLTTNLADAALIENLSFDHYPRIRATNTTVTYVADGGTNGRGLLTASGYTTEYYNDENNPTTFIEIDGDFTFAVEIDKATFQAVTGSATPLAVDDLFGGEPDYTPLGDLFKSDTSEEPVDFGYGGDGLLQFLFKQTGSGMLAPDGEIIGVIITTVSISSETFGAGFQSGFDNNDNGFVNIFFLPEPTSMLLLVMGLGSICIRRRRRK